MKKVFAIMIAVHICFLLCACDPGSFLINRESLNTVVSVELVEYTNPNQKQFSSWVPDHFKKLLPFVSANAAILERLPSDRIPDFLDAFSQTDILHTYYVYNSPKDICIKLNYENGNFLILWADYKDNSYAGYIGEYSSDGTVLSFWGSFSSLRYYKELINQHFNYNLE